VPEGVAMDLSNLLSKMMDLTVVAKTLADAVNALHQEIQKLILTKVDVDEIHINEEE
jgi:hypothetical protein